MIIHVCKGLLSNKAAHVLCAGFSAVGNQSQAYSDGTCLENISHTQWNPSTCTCVWALKNTFLTKKMFWKAIRAPLCRKWIYMPLLRFHSYISVPYVLPNPECPFPCEWWLLKWGKEQKYRAEPCRQPLCSSSCQGDAVHSVSKSEQLSHLQTDLQATTSMLWPVVKKWENQGKMVMGTNQKAKITQPPTLLLKWNIWASKIFLM